MPPSFLTPLIRHTHYDFTLMSTPVQRKSWLHQRLASSLHHKRYPTFTLACGGYEILHPYPRQACCHHSSVCKTRIPVYSLYMWRSTALCCDDDILECSSVKRRRLLTQSRRHNAYTIVSHHDSASRSNYCSPTMDTRVERRSPLQCARRCNRNHWNHCNSWRSCPCSAALDTS